MTIEQICEAFEFKGKFTHCERLSNGIINSSFKVFCDDNGNIREYVVQKINKAVFRRPDRIMDNIIAVTEFLKKKAIQEGKDPERCTLSCCGTTKDGKSYFIDDSGDYWRSYLFIGNSVVYNDSNDLSVIEQVGKAFGEFQSHLIDFDAEVLYVSIPNFHNTSIRYDRFYEALEVDACDRGKYAKPEIEELRRHEEKACKLSIMAKNNILPMRVTHNDTKSNNVIFDSDGKNAIAVIDLDTIMPGLVAYDFGDAVRFICNDAAEDETDLRKVKLDLDKFRALTKGFLSATGHSLTRIEVDSLVYGVYSMTVELALRFLTDYLDGDRYFRIDYPGHNLDRARCQLKLADDILSKFDSLEKIINESI